MVRKKIWINPNLSKKDLMDLKKFEAKLKKKPYITYRKSGRMDWHSSLLKAKLIAKAQALSGRRGFVDKDMGKTIKNIIVFHPKKK